MSQVSMTMHAQERARERRIGFDEIRTCAARGTEIARDGESKTIKFHKLCVVISLKTDDIVTVFRMETDKRRAKMKRKHERKARIHNKHDRMR